MKNISLDQLPLGCVGRVGGLQAQGKTQRRLLDLGLTKDTIVKTLYQSPSGDPRAYQFRGAVFALRSTEAAQILLVRD